LALDNGFLRRPVEAIDGLKNELVWVRSKASVGAMLLLAL
jgi:hypothetical protein